MKILDSYPVIVTEALRECRDFYVTWFEFEVAFDPAGMWVDIVEQIEPQAGWWDPYLPG
jgi:hypothetical protein